MQRATCNAQRATCNVTITTPTSARLAGTFVSRAAGFGYTTQPVPLEDAVVEGAFDAEFTPDPLAISEF
jgi:hypothetical protein